MKSPKYLLSLCLLYAASALAEPPAFVSEAVRDEAQKSYIFVFHDNVEGKRVPAHANALVVREGGMLRHTFTTAIKGFSATLSPVAAERIARSPAVAYYEPNGVAWAIGVGVNKRPTSPGTKPNEEEPSASQVTPPGVTRVGGPVDGSGKHAWVIDTGIDTEHADLLVGSGANFVLRGKYTVKDGNGHGTHVAGTIAALDNSLDVVGVAAGATVHPVRVLDNSGSGTIDGVVAGIDYVAANGAAGDVANMSLGASGHFESLHSAVVTAAAGGVRFAVAAGNSANYALNYEPAHIEAVNVYTVSAVDAGDKFASFSNWGNPPIEFAAPGVAILSTKKGGGTTVFSGTSMATPHVAGLLLFGNPVASGYAINDPDGAPDPIAHH